MLQRNTILDEMNANYSSTHIKEYNSTNNAEPTLYLEGKTIFVYGVPKITVYQY